MAFLCATGARPLQLVLGFHRPGRIGILRLSAKASPVSFGIRLGSAIKLQARKQVFTVLASNSDSSGGNSVEKSLDGSRTSDHAQGPPFATIIAGFLAFFLLAWIFGSIIMWLIGLFLKSPPSS